MKRTFKTVKIAALLYSKHFQMLSGERSFELLEVINLIFTNVLKLFVIQNDD